jgi:hypothetical protein
MEREGKAVRGCVRDVSFWLKPSLPLYSTHERIDSVFVLKAKIVISQTAVQMQAPLPEVNRLRNITRSVTHSEVGSCGQPNRIAPCSRIEPDVDLIVMKVGACRKQCMLPKHLEGMKPLRTGTLLQAGVVLLNAISIDFVVQEERKIREEVEQRPA